MSTQGFEQEAAGAPTGEHGSAPDRATASATVLPDARIPPADAAAIDPAVAFVRERCQYWSDIADKHRDARRTFAIRAALVGPIAVALLAAQILLLQQSYFWSVVFISLELFLLFCAVATGALEIGKSHSAWIEARLRSELLRREEFLYRARVGPYLQSQAADREAGTRVRLIEAEGTNPVEMIPMEEPDGATWQDAVEDDGPGEAPSEPNFVERYLDERVRHQKDVYYGAGEHRHERHETWYENGVRGVLVLAFGVAAIHLGLLVSHVEPREGQPHWLEFAALVLPPIGACVVALKTVFESHRLRRSYGDQAALLARLEQLFSNLERERSHLGKERFLRCLKRLVLRTEALISAELRRWWLIVEPEKPTSGG